MVKIKICGLTNLNDFNAANSLGADFAGFNFYLGSPRYIKVKSVYKIFKASRDIKLKKVGVFVNEKIENIIKIYNYLDLDYIQLHGDEDINYCKNLNIPYWKVIRVKDKSSLDRIFSYDTDTFLLDTYSEYQYGGTGKSFNISIVGKAIQTGKKVIIAGGISIENIDSIIQVKPYAIDINSSIEEKPGKKDIKKMEIIIKKIKESDNSNER